MTTVAVLKGNTRIAAIFAAAAIATTATLADTPMLAAYTWSEPGLANWIQNSTSVILANPGGHLSMFFGPQSYPTTVSSTACRETPADMLVTNLSFRFRAVTEVPSAIRVYLLSGSHSREWYVNLEHPPVDEWVTYDIPVDYAVGWTIGPFKTPEQFESDRIIADAVGVYVRRNGSCASQDYHIDDFQIQGYAPGDDDPVDTDGDGLPDTWEILYGLNAADASDAQCDADEDGLSNYDEYIVGTDPTNAGSLLGIAGLSVSGSEATVDCLGGAGVTQILEWTDDLTQEWMPVLTNRPNTEAWRAALDADVARGFFRLRVRE